MSNDWAEALWASIESDPNDVGAYAVLGDRLQEAGDPRGELVAAQCALQSEADKKKRKALETKSKAILKKHETSLLGALGGAKDDEVEIEWFCGYIRSATLRGTSAAPVVERMRALLTLPSARPLQALTVALRPRVNFEDDAGYTEPYGPVLEALSERASALPKMLRALSLGDGARDLTTGRLRVVGFADALQPLTQLQSLVICAGSATPGSAGLPQLRSLALRLSRMEFEGWRSPPCPTLEDLVATSWPSLERLELWFGGSEICYINESYDLVQRDGRQDASRMTLRQIDALYQSDTMSMQWENLRPYLARLLPPKAVHLGLCNLSFTDTLVQYLPTMPWWTRLRTLDLSHGTLSDAGADKLVRRADAYAHLEQIVLDGNTLTPAGIETIRAALPQARAEQQRSGRTRDPAFMSRYVASVE